MNNLLEIVYNLGMLVSLSIISGLVGHKGKNTEHKQLVQGMIFGFASILGMLHPLVLAPGLIFDGRSVMISLCGLFFGPLSAGVAAAMALSLRVYQGGPGATMGVLVILFSALIGIVFHRLKGKEEQPVPMSVLYIMGLFVHITMVLLMFTLPADRAFSTIKLLGLPVILTYPLATVLIGKILSESIEHRLTTESLAASENSLRSIFEGTTDPILIFRGYTIADCNLAALRVFGGNIKEDLIGRHVEELSPELQEDGTPSREKALKLLDECRAKASIRFEWIHLTSNGDPMIAEVVLTAITLKGERVAHAMIRDITERKTLEKRLEHLSYHDQLTGIYNRRFFEEEIHRLNVHRNLPLTLMMADVNGLKLVNDSFGHAVGDRLLIEVSKLIKAGLREDDIVSRIGGDEFVVIFPNTTSEKAEEIATRINELASKEKVESLDISISFGWASKCTEEEDIQDVLKKAEDYLYKKKLFESPSIRSKTILTIIHTLHEKNKREEAHSHRVSAICEHIGRHLGLTDSKVKELKNLGLLHDIGKIAIDEHMLNKPGRLTEDEWNEMAKHPEIGYRILSTVNEMAEMAESVLAHHERWDGKGYPKGLKGEEIPLHARIICLADAFDAMTSDRSYRLAMSHETAIEELRRNSGTQFAPEIVAAFLEMMDAETIPWVHTGAVEM